MNQSTAASSAGPRLLGMGLVFLALLVAIILGPRDRYSGREMLVRGTVFVVQLPTSPETLGVIPLQADFRSARLERADRQQLVLGANRTVPPALQRDLITLYTTWCDMGVPAWPHLPSQPQYEISYRCPTDAQTIHTERIPGSALPPALGDLVRLTFWQ